MYKGTCCCKTSSRACVASNCDFACSCFVGIAVLLLLSVCDAATNFFFANARSCKRLTFSSGTRGAGCDFEAIGLVGFGTAGGVGVLDCTSATFFVGLDGEGRDPPDLMAPNCWTRSLDLPLALILNALASACSSGRDKDSKSTAKRASFSLKLVFVRHCLLN